jgi:hypothetical protein
MILRRGTIVVAAAVVFVGPVNAASKAQLTSGPVKAHQLTGLRRQTERKWNSEC